MRGYTRARQVNGFSMARRRHQEGPSRPRLVDIAKRANVSVAAVSYALNGAPGVSDETRARILEVADAIDYRPNRIATTLRSGHALVFGLLVPDLANPFSAELAAGVLRAAGSAG